MRAHGTQDHRPNIMLLVCFCVLQRVIMYSCLENVSIWKHTEVDTESLNTVLREHLGIMGIYMNTSGGKQHGAGVGVGVTAGWLWCACVHTWGRWSIKQPSNYQLSWPLDSGCVTFLILGHFLALDQMYVQAIFFIKVWKLMSFYMRKICVTVVCVEGWGSVIYEGLKF